MAKTTSQRTARKLARHVQTELKKGKETKGIIEGIPGVGAVVHGARLQYQRGREGGRRFWSQVGEGEYRQAVRDYASGTADTFRGHAEMMSGTAKEAIALANPGEIITGNKTMTYEQYVALLSGGDSFSARKNMAGRPGRHGLPRNAPAADWNLAKLPAAELKAFAEAGNEAAQAELERRISGRKARTGMQTKSRAAKKEELEGLKWSQKKNKWVKDKKKQKAAKKVKVASSAEGGVIRQRFPGKACPNCGQDTFQQDCVVVAHGPKGGKILGHAHAEDCQPRTKKKKAKANSSWHLSRSPETGMWPHHPVYEQVTGQFGVSEDWTHGLQPMNRRNPRHGGRGSLPRDPVTGQFLPRGGRRR